MFHRENHSLAMPFLVPPSKPRRSGFTEFRIVDDPAAVRRELKRQEKAEQRDTPEALPAEVAGPLIRQVMDDHYRKCLNEPVGMLEGKSPRAAVRSKQGRDQVVEWLKYLENSAARRAADDPTAAYDFTWMWAELGITDLRK